MAASSKDKAKQIRGGFASEEEGYQFELSGGELCLDFANTVDSRPLEPRELLTNYRGLVDWGLQSGALDESASRALLAAAESRPQEAAAAVKAARTTREAIFQVFASAVRGDDPPRDELDRLNGALRKAMARLALVPDEAAYGWTWDEEFSFDRPLWPVVRSAAELLTSDRLDRVRECAADDCAWLFLDASRNRSRRWCDMKVCGNRNKVRRFRKANL